VNGHFVDTVIRGYDSVKKEHDEKITLKPSMNNDPTKVAQSYSSKFIASTTEFLAGPFFLSSFSLSIYRLNMFLFNF